MKLSKLLHGQRRIFVPLQHRPFSLLWFGQTISGLGDRIYATALPFLVLAIGGSAERLSVAFAWFSLPQLVFLLAGGVVSDRLSRRLTILAADTIQAVSLSLTIALLSVDALRLWHVYVLSAVFGACSAFSLPAARGLVPELVAGPRLVAANALNAISAELNGILGPLIGAMLVASGGVALALGIDGFTFAISAACLVLMGTPGAVTARSSGAPAGARGRTWTDLREGFRIVRASQWLWLTILLFSVGNVFFGGAMAVALPLFARDRLGGAAAFGWTLASVATGAMVMALVLGRFERLRRRGLIAYGGVAVSGTALMLLSTSHSPWQAVLAGLVVGASVAAFSLVWEATLQELVPGEALGRVVSIDMLGSFALLPVGYLLAGWLAGVYGAATTILISGIGTTILATVGLAVRSIRDLE